MKIYNGNIIIDELNDYIRGLFKNNEKRKLKITIKLVFLTSIEDTNLERNKIYYAPDLLLDDKYKNEVSGIMNKAFSELSNELNNLKNVDRALTSMPRECGDLYISDKNISLSLEADIYTIEIYKEELLELLEEITYFNNYEEQEYFEIYIN